MANAFSFHTSHWHAFFLSLVAFRIKLILIYTRNAIQLILTTNIIFAVHINIVLWPHCSLFGVVVELCAHLRHLHTEIISNLFPIKNDHFLPSSWLLSSYTNQFHGIITYFVGPVCVCVRVCAYECVYCIFIASPLCNFD